MRALTDSIDINAPPQAVWAWLENLADHYLDWHPDHVSAEWKEGEPNEIGSVLEVVENLGGHRERLRLEVSQRCPTRSLEYRIRGIHSLLLPAGAFEIHPRKGGSTFTASIWCRGGEFTQGLFRTRLAALREHMREEGENLRDQLTGRS